MKTRITELLGTRYPILQASRPQGGNPAMAATLAAAVSNAGGLGMLAAGAYATPEALAMAMAQCRALTDRPFGVHLSILRAYEAPFHEAYLDVAIAGGAMLLETSGDCPRAFIEKCKRQGVRVLHWCTSLREALVAERKGVDAVGLAQFDDEAGSAEASRDGLVIIPLGARTLRIPVVATSGTADGRGLAAALALGAEGASVPAPVDDIPGCAQWLERMVGECGDALAHATHSTRGGPDDNQED